MPTDWVARFEENNYREALARLVAMHRLTADDRRTAQKANRRLRVFLLVASAVTTGSLWVLLGNALPGVMKWVGGSLSTVVTIASTYQITGPARTQERLDDLFVEFGRSLAHAREHPDNFSWHNFKHLEGAYLRSGVRDPTPEEIRSAQLYGMI